MHLLKKIALMVGTGSVALVLAACYGMPYSMAYRKVMARTVDNQPIAGLKVSFEGNQSGLLDEVYTDSSGNADITITDIDTGTITVSDVDGAAN